MPKPSGSVALATCSTILIASPELMPGLESPITLAAMKPLKRSTCSGPTTFFTRLTAESGIIAPLLALLTYTLPMSSGFIR